MAQSPFATTGNVGDIAPVQLKGGFSPDTGIADAIVNVANTAIPIITKNLEDDITDDVSGKIKAVSTALEAVRFPSIQDTVFSEEALANPNVRLALAEFTKIQDAATHGRLPSTFVLERLEIIQNDAIRNAPEFESEIRGAMVDATGQDPSKTLFSRLLQESTKVKSVEQKLKDKQFIEAGEIGVTVPELIAMKQATAKNQLELQQFDLAAKRGTYALNTMGKDVAIQGSAIMTNVMQTVRKQIVAGGTVGVQQKRDLVSQVNAAFAQSSSDIMAKMSGVNVSGAAVNAELAPLDALRETTVAMIEDNTMQLILTQYSDVIVAKTINGVLNSELGRIYSISGQAGLLEYLKFMRKSGGTAQGKQLTGILSDKASLSFALDDIGKEYANIGTDIKPATAGAKKFRTIAAALLVSAPGAPDEAVMAGLKDVDTYGGEPIAWGMFNSTKMVEATAQNSILKDRFKNMQIATTGGLSVELLEMAADATIPIERLEINAIGKLQLAPLEGVGTPDRDLRAIEGQMQGFIARFNRANEISAKYHGVGILSANKYSGTQAYWETVKSAASGVVKPKEKENAPRKVVFGADGSLGFDDGGE